MADRRRLLTELEGTGRLGRHVNHDERSKAYLAPQPQAMKTVSHRHYGPVLDQGNIGACTGFSAADWLNCLPAHKRPQRLYDAQDGYTFYSIATSIDPFQGQWDYPPPPGKGEDTGSDGLSVCSALKRVGLIGGYDHAFGLNQVLGALTLGPVMVGVNWYEGFDNPNSKGIVSISGAVRGGHEFCLLGLNLKTGYVKALNHWGANFGVNGMFYFTFETLDTLLSQQGDCTVPRIS